MNVILRHHVHLRKNILNIYLYVTLFRLAKYMRGHRVSLRGGSLPDDIT